MCRSEGSVPTPSLCLATVLPADMPSHQLIKPMKPRLPRKLAKSARINLNKYWHALEELIPVTRKAFDESDCNAINENIDNEHRLAAMKLTESQGEYSKPSSMSPRDQNGKATSACSFPKTTSESFPKISEFPSNHMTAPMTMDVHSNENTPPCSALHGNASR